MNFKKVLAISFTLILCGYSVAAVSEQLAPPKYHVTDQFGINFATGQVTTSLDTVSIGSLSHTISSHSNSYMPVKTIEINPGSLISPSVNYTARSLTAYNDKFGGNARYTNLGKGVVASYFGTLALNYLYVMTVHDADGSAEFIGFVNDQPQQYIANETDISKYSFQPLTDPRHSLEVLDKKLVWTKPNGATTEYTRKANNGGAKGYLKKMTYPNGYTINIEQSINGVVKSVSTNTGFMLKYIYEVDERPLPSEKQDAQNDGRIYDSSLEWSLYNPKYVVGINRSEEYCSLASADSCNTEGWPKAEFHWPAGMPRAFYVGKSTFGVTDATGGVTEYYIEAMDRQVGDLNQVYSNGEPGKYFFPRLQGIKRAGDKSRSINYSYQNVSEESSVAGGSGSIHFDYWFEVEGGRIDEAWGILGKQKYDANDSRGVWTGEGNEKLLGVKKLAGIGDSNIEMVARSPGRFPGRLYKIISSEGATYFEQSLRNLVLGAEYADKPREIYSYNNHLNLEKITKHSNNSEEIILTQAKYPERCTALDDRKNCNQAEWIAIGSPSSETAQFTYYSYDQVNDHGQVTSVTYPENEHGIRPQTRFSYAAKTAKIKNSSGNLVPAEGSIWLKVSERYCINSTYSGDIEGGACEGNDEVETTYEYEHNNLLLTSEVVSVVENGLKKTMRTCYQYDKYGNQIGKIKPKANLSSCNFE